MQGLQEPLLSKDELSQESSDESNYEEKPASIVGSTAVCFLAAAGCKFR